MVRLIWLLLSVSLTINLISAQVMGNYEAQQRARGSQNTFSNANFTAQYRAVPKAATFVGNNVVEFTVNALSNQRADSYTAIFSVLQVGKTADVTNKRINQRIDAFKSSLLEQGIAAEDIYLDMVNFLPKYEYEESKKIFSKSTFTEVPSGFEMQKNVHIRYRDPGQLDGIITAAANVEIYDIIKVDYFVDTPQAIYAELRKSAFEYLQGIKQGYLDLGLALDSAYLITGENAWVAYPANRYEGYQAFTSQQLPATAELDKVTRAQKPYARFYNAIPANDYDIVINPTILEPAIQFSYNLKVRYTLPERNPVTRTIVKKEPFVLTPEGKVIKVQLK